MEPRGAVALVTGASGFIGSRLAERLAAEGAQVRGLVRAPERVRRLPAGVAPVLGDLTDPDSLARAVAGCDLVVHCAAYAGPGGPLRRFAAVNVAGTRALADAALVQGVRRFVHFSTIAVYGTDHAEPVRDDSPRRAHGDPYAVTKLAGEEAVWEVHRRGLPATVIRPSFVYGPGWGAWTVAPVRAIQRGAPVLVGDGGGICTPIYLDNLVDATLLAIRADHAVGRGYLVWDGLTTTWRSFFGCYGRMLGKPVRSVPRGLIFALAALLEAAGRLTGRAPLVTRAALRMLSPGLPLAATGARDELGWTPRVGLDEGMAHTERWLREHGYLGR